MKPPILEITENITLTYEANPDPDDIQRLEDGITIFATQKTNHQPIDFFAFFLRNEHNKLRGGCNGNTLYGSLYIDQLWVQASLRKKGYGTKLMLAAEQWGKEKDCIFSTVNTMDWEALNFYIKLGYEVEFERHGFAEDSVFYFLRKNL